MKLIVAEPVEINKRNPSSFQPEMTKFYKSFNNCKQFSEYFLFKERSCLTLRNGMKLGDRLTNIPGDYAKHDVQKQFVKDHFIAHSHETIKQIPPHGIHNYCRNIHCCYPGHYTARLEELHHVIAVYAGTNTSLTIKDNQLTIVDKDFSEVQQWQIVDINGVPFVSAAVTLQWI